MKNFKDTVHILTRSKVCNFVDYEVSTNTIIVLDLKIFSEVLITIAADASILVWKIQSDIADLPAASESQIIPIEKKVSVMTHSFDSEPIVFGLSTNLRQNFIWHSTTELFAFVVGSFVVIEDLKTKNRRYLRHHQSPITALCVSDDGLLLSTSSNSLDPTQYTDVCLWNTIQDKPISILQHHLTPVKVSLDQSTAR